MTANLLRRVNWLWKHRHTHDDNFQEQITLLKTKIETQTDSVTAAVTAINDNDGSGGQVVQAVYDLIGSEPRNAEALAQASTGGAYVWPDDALSASVQFLHFNQGDWGEVLFARWVLIWHPNGDTGNGVRLIHADAGPTNITEISEHTNKTGTDPIVSTTDITTDLQALIDGGAAKQFGYQIKTTGTGMKVYQSRLEVLWRVGNVDADTVRDAGRWEVVVDGNPATEVTTEDGSDWVYGWVS